MVDELRRAGATVNPDGTVNVYHRTTPEAAAQIRASGAMRADEDGLFFSTSPTGQAEGYGEAVVAFDIPVNDLELDDIFDGEAHLRVPLSGRGSVDVGQWRLR